jgi:hypothetical protein
MEARQDPRFKVRLRTHQSANDHPDMNGTVLDLSLHGCRIGSTTPVNPGMVFSLRIEVPGCEQPIQIERAEVRWVKAMEFGLSFYAFTTNAYERLVAVIQQLQL